MPLYIYTGRDEDGNVVTRKIERDTAEQVVECMKAYGCLAVKVRKASFFHMEVTRAVTKKDIAIFCRQFSHMANSGIQIVKALDIIQSLSVSKRLKQVLRKVNADVMKGGMFSESMEKYKEFPTLLVNMTYVGELSGDIGGVYGSMADYYEREYKRSEEIRSAMLYPAAVSIIMLIIIVIALVSLVPSYASIYAANSSELPIVTTILIKASSFLSRHLMWLLAVVMVLFGACVVFFRTFAGKYFIGRFKLMAPIYKTVYKKSINATFVEVMGILLNAPYPVTESLVTVKKVVNNPYLDEHFDSMIIKVESGFGLSDAMESFGYFEQYMCGMLRIGEESGRLPYAFDNCSNYLNLDLNIMLSRFGKLIEPAIILILGLILGFVMLSIMLPAFNLGSVL